jgi:transposase
MERMMKALAVILKAMAGKLNREGSEIIGVCDRTMRRWRKRYEEYGYDRAVRIAANGAPA